MVSSGSISVSSSRIKVCSSWTRTPLPSREGGVRVLSVSVSSPGRGATTLLLILGLLLLCSSLPSQEANRVEPQISTAHLGVVKISVQLADSPPVVPSLPDLSRPGVIDIPGGCYFQSPLPILWSGVLLPPGRHQLLIEVDQKSRTSLQVRSLAGGPPLSIPVVRAVLHRPDPRLLATVAVVEGESDRSIHLTLRWGALLLTATGNPAEALLHEVDGWKLQTYRFPDGIQLPPYCVLGTVEDPGGEVPLLRAVLVTTTASTPQLRLENPARERAAAAIAEVNRSLRRPQQRLRRIDGGAEASTGEKEQLEREIQRARQRRSALEKQVQLLDSGEGVKVIPCAGKPGPGQPGLLVTLESTQDRTYLKVIHGGGSFLFLLEA